VRRASAPGLRRLHAELLIKNADLERSNQELQAMQDLALAIRDTSTVESVQERLLAIITDQLHFDRAVVGLVEPSGQAVTGWLACGARLKDVALPHAARALLDGAPSSGVARALATRMSQHARSDELPPLGVPSVDTQVWPGEYAAVPMVCRNGPLGAILVDNPCSGQPIRPEALDGLTRLANQAALALANVRMCVERAQRSAVAGERQRIASEMHDAVIQSLFGMAVHLEACSNLLERDPERVRVELDELRGMALDLLGELRGAVQGLWTGECDGAWLVSVLRRHAEEIRRLSGVEVTLNVQGDPLSLGEVGARTLYRIAQEALSNATRHSTARAATIDLSFELGTVSLAVADSGVGFDPRRACDGLGLRSMRERAASVGGQCEIDTRPGGGTRVMTTIPCC
jgi:nitrate/nitrite-specific signal transduction histidine kinase